MKQTLADHDKDEAPAPLKDEDRYRLLIDSITDYAI